MRYSQYLKYHKNSTVREDYAIKKDIDVNLFRKNIGGFTYQLDVNDIGYQRSSLGMRFPEFRFGVAANTLGEYCQLKCMVFKNMNCSINSTYFYLIQHIVVGKHKFCYVLIRKKAKLSKTQYKYSQREFIVYIRNSLSIFYIPYMIFKKHWIKEIKINNFTAVTETLICQSALSRRGICNMLNFQDMRNSRVLLILFQCTFSQYICETWYFKTQL